MLGYMDKWAIDFGWPGRWIYGWVDGCVDGYKYVDSLFSSNSFSRVSIWGFSSSSTSSVLTLMPFRALARASETWTPYQKGNHSDILNKTCPHAVNRGTSRIYFYFITSSQVLHKILPRQVFVNVGPFVMQTTISEYLCGRIYVYDCVFSLTWFTQAKPLRSELISQLISSSVYKAMQYISRSLSFICYWDINQCTISISRFPESIKNGGRI